MIYIFFNMISVSFFIFGLPNMIKNFTDLKNDGARIYDPITKIFQCLKCLSFWFALFFTGSFFIACQVSLLGYLFDKYIINKY